MGSKWTLSEPEQRQVNEEIKNLNVFSVPTTSLYHYTSREVFWKIIEGESFLARHIQFSNDSEENRIGKKKMEEAMKAEKSVLAPSDALPFMICFCEEEDLLSQWRGYAKEGIAIEFDFSKGLYGAGTDTFSTYYCYTIMNAEGDSEYMSVNSGGEDSFMGAIASPYKVIYTSADEQLGTEITDRVKSIIKMSATERLQQNAVNMVPYIKNEHFNEENEYRLIFDMRQLVSGEEKLLSQKYIYIDVEGVKKPNIRVRFGNQYTAKNEEKVTIYYSDRGLKDKFDTFAKDMSKDRSIIVQPKRETGKKRLKPNEILLSEGKNQELVCTKLRQMFYQEDIKIWCDGHLPIRRIIVGPSKDAKLMQDSIEEYKKTKYWMRDIEVEVSKIPLRI